MKGNRLGESVVSFFKRRRERKLLKNSFGRYVSAEELTAILNGKECVGTSESSEETIFFLIAHVRDQTLEEVPNLVREATEVIVDHGGLVTSRFSSCIMAVFRPKWELANHVKCVEAARQLVDRLGVSVRVVYGSAVGFFTTLGSGVSMSYGPVLPGFLELLSEVRATRPGEAREIACANGDLLDRGNS